MVHAQRLDPRQHVVHLVVTGLEELVEIPLVPLLRRVGEDGPVRIAPAELVPVALKTIESHWEQATGSGLQASSCRPAALAQHALRPSPILFESSSMKLLGSASVCRIERLPPNSPRPAPALRLPYEDVGACPFEGCVYQRTWVANRTVGIRTERRAGAPVAFRLTKGAAVQAMTGVVVTHEGRTRRVSKARGAIDRVGAACESSRARPCICSLTRARD